MRPFLCLIDEPSQVEPSQRDRLLAAVSTGLGKTPGSRMLVLGTKSSDPHHWFSRMLEGEGVAYAQVHAAGENDPPFSIATIRKANPSIDHLPSLKAQVLKEAAAARNSPELQPQYEALRLNKGVSDTMRTVVLDPATWKRIEGNAPKDGRCFWGIDLGGAAASSAVTAWFTSGRLESVATFPTEPYSLAERGLKDGVGNLYVRAEARGELVTTGGHAADYTALMRLALERFGPPAAIACDRYDAEKLIDALRDARVPPVTLEKRANGFYDGANDLEAFIRACLEGKVTPQPSLLLTSAFAEARTVMDSGGNWKLATGSQSGQAQSCA